MTEEGVGLFIVNVKPRRTFSSKLFFCIKHQKTCPASLQSTDPFYKKCAARGDNAPKIALAAPSATTTLAAVGGALGGAVLGCSATVLLVLRRARRLRSLVSRAEVMRIGLERGLVITSFVEAGAAQHYFADAAAEAEVVAEVLAAAPGAERGRLARVLDALRSR